MTKIILIATLALGAAACGGGGDSHFDAAHHPDARELDANPNPDAACYTNPVTHHEIINACTDPAVVKIDKHPVLPLLNPDGTLPPLP